MIPFSKRVYVMGILAFSRVIPAPRSIAVRILTPGDTDPVSPETLSRYAHVCTITGADHDEGLHPDDAKQVIQFLDTYGPDATEIVVHCTMGVSRSRGLVLGYLERIKDPYVEGFLRTSPLHNRGWAQRMRDPDGD